MINLAFINGTRKIEFCLETIKFVHFKTNEDHWLIRQCLNKELYKIPLSEYKDETKGKTYIEIDGEPLSKDCELININESFNLEEDLKLGAKSLMIKYISNKLVSKEYSDEVVQLNSMFSLLSELISDDMITFIANDLNGKNLPKLMEAKVLKDELISNSLDLTFEEFIEFQVNIVKGIVNGTKNYLVVINIKLLTQSLYQLFAELSNLCKVVVIWEYSNVVLLNNNIYVDGIDYENEEKLYERMNNMSNYYNLEEYIKSLKDEHLTRYLLIR